MKLTFAKSKTKYVFIVILVMLYVLGCNKSNDHRDSQISSLEGQVAELNDQVSDLESRIDDLELER